MRGMWARWRQRKSVRACVKESSSQGNEERRQELGLELYLGGGADDLLLGVLSAGFPPSEETPTKNKSASHETTGEFDVPFSMGALSGH